MKQITINGRVLGIVDVPEDAYGFSLYIDGLYWLVDRGTLWGELHSMTKGNWSILGRLNDITEEQAAGIVERFHNGYRDYDIPDNRMAASLLKATESLQSFFQSHGIKGNPLILLLNDKV